MTEMTKSPVIIENTDSDSVFSDFVVLPESFGTPAYDLREDVIAVRGAVDRALSRLDELTGFTGRIRGRKVIIKPNLVSVYHDSGFRDRDYPETTDPRVFEAVVRFVSRYTDDITIAESSGKPMPTTVNFKTTGYDRIAKYYRTALVALETRPVKRYMLPKAEVMKEVYIPDTLVPAVEGDAFYISVPKMKTNLYTGVTLSFKNAMGTIPYFLRERNHSYLINKKLADLLYLFRPDLTVIDAVVGGEGNTPAPVDPVRVGRIIVSTNSVEADRTATRIMGFDPEAVPLMREAVARGFGDSGSFTEGDISPVSFRPAVSSFMDDKTHREFPGILALAGHTVNGAPGITDPGSVTPETARKLEAACTGGCLAAAKTGIDYYNYSDASGKDFRLTIVIGSGVPIDGVLYWFDRDGKPYTLKDISSLPGRTLALGSCASAARDACGYSAEGCCDPAASMAAVCRAAGVPMPIMTPGNRKLPALAAGMLATVLRRRQLIRKGEYVDCPYAQEDRIFPVPDHAGDEDFLEWPLPPMTASEKRHMMRDQWKILWSAVFGGIKRSKERPV